MKRSGRRAVVALELAECAYCQDPQPRLYRLPLIRPMGELTDMAVCVFCYIHLAGVKPPRESLLATGG